MDYKCCKSADPGGAVSGGECGVVKLTPIQQGIVLLVAVGCNRREIARAFGVCKQRIGQQVREIVRVLGIDPDKDPDAVLTLWAFRLGLIYENSDI